MLIGCIYKTIAKVLSRKLEGVLNTLMRGKGLLLGGRSMLDGVVVANEVAEKAKRCKKECMILKVDHEKAYNSLWSFFV